VLGHIFGFWLPVGSISGSLLIWMAQMDEKFLRDPAVVIFGLGVAFAAGGVVITSNRTAKDLADHIKTNNLQHKEVKDLINKRFDGLVTHDFLNARLLKEEAKSDLKYVMRDDCDEAHEKMEQKIESIANGEWRGPERRKQMRPKGETL